MRPRIRATALGLTLLLAHGAATATVLPRKTDHLAPEGEVLEHPKEMRLELLPLEGPIGRGLVLCAYYGTTKANQKGKISVRGELHRDGEIIESVEFRGRIRDAEAEDGIYSREFLLCSKTICSAEGGSSRCQPRPAKEFNSVPQADDVFVFYLRYKKLRDLAPDEVAEVTVGPYPRSGS